ncbi:UDP-N-acetylglucosamine--dolichyl-phosphate N-acetylglucosaminephosphotransferase [Nematocida sp. ERTm5]|nr:UDP-N-acetylglucosamine--dolichyl-phosphate N-acetylglucosaminephosphotransferase [Nematocida sp. ERTm5]
MIGSYITYFMCAINNITPRIINAQNNSVPTPRSILSESSSYSGPVKTGIPAVKKTIELNIHSITHKTAGFAGVSKTCALLSIPIMSGIVSYKLSLYFMKLSRTFGIDHHKRSKEKIPESIGLSSAISFVLCIFILSSFFPSYKESLLIFSNTIILNTLMGYVDDTVDLSWSCKLLFPIIATFPLIITYSGSTSMVVPFYGVYNLGNIFYALLILLGIYFTNAINILSGINGVECGQILVISSMMCIDRCIFPDEKSTLSALLCLSLFTSSYGLFMWNKYPSKCFVGDVFCYFSGSALLCIGLFGGFMKTLFLFLIPQLFNFVLSTPQMFKILPCPRHRMPSVKHLDGPESITALIPSTMQCKKTYIATGYLRQAIVRVYKFFNLVSYTENEETVEISNFTILNVILVWCGPIQEKTLFYIYSAIQAAVCTFIILIKLYFVPNESK